MLKQLRLKNFRAFKSLDASFSKINVFVGPNNSGKSSIISAINLIAQNTNLTSGERGLSLNGDHVELGTYHDMVHGHNSKSHVSIGFNIGHYKYDYKYKYRLQRREIELSDAVITDNFYEYHYINNGDTSSHYINECGKKKSKIVLKRKPVIKGLVLNINFALHDLLRMESDQIKEGDTYSSIRRFYAFSIRRLESTFGNYENVGAFRVAPQRTYHFTGESPSGVGRFGEHTAQMLANSVSDRRKYKFNVQKMVSQWFLSSGAAREIKVKPLTNRHFEMVVVDRTGRESNIIDAGLGCAQVLPVLAGGWNLIKEESILKTRPIFIVQEPEIHLHPTAAAHLGTYFTDLATEGVQCFIETHSENIVLRIAQHVAKGDLDSRDVKIYWVSEVDGEHQVTELGIRSDGTFDRAWPEGFFPTRSLETIALARATAQRSAQNSEQRTEQRSDKVKV